MSSTTRRAKEKAGVQEKILDAARRLFVEHGYDAVSMRKIAEAIEYTAPALYVHFKDKRELMFALCHADYGALRDAGREADGIADPVERLRAMGKSYARFALKHPHQYRFMFMSRQPTIEPDEMKQCGHGDPEVDGYAALRQCVAACIGAGRFRPEFRDVEKVTTACWGAAHGVVSLHIVFERDPWVKWRDPQKTAFLLIDGFVDGMVAAGAKKNRRARA